MKKAPTLAEASPYKSVAQELETLRGLFRVACRQYAERVEMEIIRVHEQVVDAGLQAAEREKMVAAKTMPGSAAARGTSPAARGRAESELVRVRDLRDMLTLLRTMQIKPQEGRRKDLKKIESIVSDLELLTADWG